MNAISDAAARAPDVAGVYFFLAADTELLYVGKAGSLRKRLYQHARAKPGSGGARLDVLYQRVAAIRWAELPDEDAATNWETDLIVGLRPAFNAASSTEKGIWNHILVTPADGGGHTLRFTLAPRPEMPAGRAYGCFPHLGKGVATRPGIACSDGYTALLRLLWAASDSRGHIPSRITRSAPDEFATTVDPAFRTSLHALLSGTSGRLLDDLAAAGRRRESYLRPGLARDRAAAESFFVYGPKAVRRLRLRHGVRPGPMPRAVIEDLLAADVRAAIGDVRLPARPDQTDRELGRKAVRWQ